MYHGWSLFKLLCEIGHESPEDGIHRLSAYNLLISNLIEGGEAESRTGTWENEKAKVVRLKVEQAHAETAWEKEKAEVVMLKSEQEHAASAWEKEKVEVTRLMDAASAWEKEKSKLERKVEHLEKVLAGELYFQKEKERYEGLLQELKDQLNSHSQIFKAQMQDARCKGREGTS